LDRFNSLDGLRSWLPQVDPRTVIPGMRERDHDDPVVLDVSADQGQEDADEGPNTLKPEKRREPPVSLYLSDVQPSEGSYHPNYLGFPYHERKRHAGSHAENALPSIPGKDPWGKLVKVVNDCIHHYGMSDKTTWEIVRDRFNPRCMHGDGRR